MTQPELLALRDQIDEIDERLVGLLAGRFDVTEAIGRLKAEAGAKPVDPSREREQGRRYEALAQSHGLDPALVQQVFRTIIDEVVRRHAALAARAASAQD
ncbi:chorismate mutase [Niveibacterium microcysteis]|uniref:chorismate mutase n=1 Tax=Niveibacterium microcysteis TaxID=2811415 RepID=A0ABX7MAR2_9RHOO|nr:chorismate mutase [Niveibacterium microcysteis]QSI77560.1 chorismate mutase [Niveibacterium microcysteis]